MTVVAPLPAHPAKFSDPIVDRLDQLVAAERRRLGRPVRVLDPFAGVGRVHRLARPGQVETVGIEIEPEWAACHSATICADSLAWMRDRGYDADRAADAGQPAPPRFDMAVFSPVYGNRMSDAHEARDGSVRHSYTHDLGRPLTEGSAGALPWGPRFWRFHADAYRLLTAVLVPGGLVLLNVSDFVRAKTVVPAVAWHVGALYGAGFVQDQRPVAVETRRLRFGANGERAPAEVIIRARLGGAT